MTYEEARSFLNSYADMWLVCKEAIRRLEEFRARNEGLKAIASDGMPKAQGGTRDLSEYVAELDELESQLTHVVGVYAHRATEVVNAINAVQDPLLAEVLKMKYIDRKTLVAIAVKIGYSYPQTLRIHHRAVEAVAMQDDIE